MSTKQKIAALIVRYQAGRLTQSGLYRRTASVYYTEGNHK